MSTSDRALRPGVTDPADDIAPHVSENRFRRKRFQLFLDLISPLAATREKIRVLDIGGARNYWEGVRDLWGHLPLEITIVNIGGTALDDPPYYIRTGDACDLHDYADNSFDVVHSNSVIEHVGHWNEIEAMAREVRRLADHYYIQTPNFWFPFEPHYRTLFFHWWPETVRARMLMKKKRGFLGPEPTMSLAMANIQAVNLLDARQMAEIFPDATIFREKFSGLTKSLVALR